MYDVENCETPQIPPACPILEVTGRFPCPRFACFEDDNETVNPKKSRSLMSGRQRSFEPVFIETTSSRPDFTRPSRESRKKPPLQIKIVTTSAPMNKPIHTTNPTTEVYIETETMSADVFISTEPPKSSTSAYSEIVEMVQNHLEEAKKSLEEVKQRLEI